MDFLIEKIRRRELQGNGNQICHGPIPERIPDRMPKRVFIPRYEIFKKFLKIPQSHKFQLVCVEIYALKRHDDTVYVYINRKNTKLEKRKREHTDNENLDFQRIFNLSARIDHSALPVMIFDFFSDCSDKITHSLPLLLQFFVIRKLASYPTYP